MMPADVIVGLICLPVSSIAGILAYWLPMSKKVALGFPVAVPALGFWLGARFC